MQVYASARFMNFFCDVPVAKHGCCKEQDCTFINILKHLYS